MKRPFHGTARVSLVDTMARLDLSINALGSGAGKVGAMKTKRAMVYRRRRVRFWAGWVVVVAVASIECLFIQQVTNDGLGMTAEGPWAGHSGVSALFVGR
jgi:hypothetical protein